MWGASALSLPRPVGPHVWTEHVSGDQLSAKFTNSHISIDYIGLQPHIIFNNSAFTARLSADEWKWKMLTWAAEILTILILNWGEHSHNMYAILADLTLQPLLVRNCTEHSTACSVCSRPGGGLACMWAMSKFELTFASLACQSSHGMSDKCLQTSSLCFNIDSRPGEFALTVVRKYIARVWETLRESTS